MKVPDSKFHKETVYIGGCRSKVSATVVVKKKLSVLSMVGSVIFYM